MSYGRSIWCFFVTGVAYMSLCHGSGEAKGSCGSKPCGPGKCDEKSKGCVGCEDG